MRASRRDEPRESVFARPAHLDALVARVDAEGYEEISRTKLIEPTTPPQTRRELKAVNWSHPAYANRHIIARNDKQVVRYSLER